MKQSPKLPLWQSLLWIVGSVFICTGSSYKIFQIYIHKKHEKIPEKKPQMIEYIVQTGVQKEALHSDYLAELLDLSWDKQTLFSFFNEKNAEEKLRACPLIEEVSVRKIPPNMIYIDYKVRKPIGWVADFMNTGVDAEGRIFPITPFFSPKKMPEIYLGKKQVENVSFSQPLEGKYFALASQVIHALTPYERNEFFLKKVDVSDAFYPTLGKRGIVIVLEHELLPSETISTHFLRLSTENYSQEIANYLSLLPSMIENDKEKVFEGKASLERVIDLRVPQLAFIE